jgi:hypothetical protein
MTFPPKMAAFRNSLEANHSPSQLTPYDHLNMAITVTLMQVTVPPAVALILRYHTDDGTTGEKNLGKAAGKGAYPSLIHHLGVADIFWG